MEWLKTWLLAITGAALVAALADAITPSGAPRKTVLMAAGLLLLLAVLRPVKELKKVDFSEILEDFRGEYAGYKAILVQESEAGMKSIIEEKVGAYILDKATALGLEECSVAVICRVEEAGFPVPQAVTVRGKGADNAWSALGDAIVTDFSIEPENQTFERTDAP